MKNKDTISSSLLSENSIHYRSNVQCTGDIAWETLAADPTMPLESTFQSSDGYGRCVSRCLGKTGVIAFNWVNRGSSTSICQCLRMVAKSLYQI